MEDTTDFRAFSEVLCTSKPKIHLRKLVYMRDDTIGNAQEIMERIKSTWTNESREDFLIAKEYLQKLVWYRRNGLIPDAYWYEKGKFDAANFCHVLEQHDLTSWYHNCRKNESDTYHDRRKHYQHDNRDSCYTYMQEKYDYKPHPFVKTFCW